LGGREVLFRGGGVIYCPARLSFHEVKILVGEACYLEEVG